MSMDRRGVPRDAKGQRRIQIEAELLASPRDSYQAIAARHGVSKQWIGTVAEKLREQEGAL